jgi:hypothetical protein
MMTSLTSRVTSRHIGIVLALAAAVVAIQKYFAVAYNNYLVFVGSLKVLLAHQDLYAPHPEFYGDLFKYSPTFPLFMLPFLWLPLPVGLVCWNVLNAGGRSWRWLLPASSWWDRCSTFRAMRWSRR